MEEQMCPRCKTTKYRNPFLKLMVNTCGHALCENCIEALFVRGSGNCIQCGTALRRANFRAQIFEDENVEKEMDIRRKVMKDYNKLEEDFPTLLDYNNYLEEVENLVFNMVNDIDVEETKRKVDEYKKTNATLIKKNKIKLSRDNEMIENLLEEEKVSHDRRKKQMLVDDVKEKNDRKQKKDALIDDLMSSDLPASHILTTHRKQSENTPTVPITQQEPSISIGSRGATFKPIPKQEGAAYRHTPLIMETFGPACIDLNNLAEDGYLKHIRATAKSELGGGFHVKIAVQRAVQEALCGIFHGFDSSRTPSPAFSSGSSSDKQACGGGGDVEMVESQ